MEALNYKKRILLKLTSSRFWMGLLGGAVCAIGWLGFGYEIGMWGMLAALGIYSIAKTARA